MFVLAKIGANKANTGHEQEAASSAPRRNWPTRRRPRKAAPLLVPAPRNMGQLHLNDREH